MPVASPGPALDVVGEQAIARENVKFMEALGPTKLSTQSTFKSC